jgi:hypothetical protein
MAYFPSIAIGVPFFRAFAGFSVEYTAILTRGTALGYTLPSSAQQSKQNALLVALKTAGIWTKLDTFYVYANDGSKEFGTLNWKTPSLYQNTLVNSPTWTSNAGFNSDGSTSYIDTGFNAATNGVNFTNNSASEFVYQTGGTNGVVCGTSGGPGDALFINDTVAHRLNMFGTNLLATANMSGSGFKCINRTSSTLVELFNETTQLSRVTTTASRINANRRVLNGQNNFLDTFGKVSVYGNGANLTAEALTLRTSIITYLTSL